MQNIKHGYRKYAVIVLILVALPMLFISIGEYNLSTSLSKTEEKEILQVIYSLGASLIILLYYGYKWLIQRSSNIIIGFTVCNILGLTSLVLLIKTIEHYLVMDSDIYFLIVYSEIVIIHIVHHMFYRTAV